MRFSLPRKLYAVLVITAVLPLTVAVMEAVDTFEHWTKSEYRLELQEQQAIFRAFLDGRAEQLRERLSLFAARADVVRALNSKNRNRLLTHAISGVQASDWEVFYLVSTNEDLLIDPINMTRGEVDPRYDFHLALALSHQHSVGLEYDPALGMGIVASSPIYDVQGQLLGAVTVFDPLAKEWLDIMKAMTNHDFALISRDRRTISSTWLPRDTIVPALQELPEADAPAKLVANATEYFASQAPLTDLTDAVIAQVLITKTSTKFHAALRSFRIDFGALALGALGFALALGFLLSRAITYKLNQENLQRIEAEEATKKSHELLKEKGDQVEFMQDIARIANEAKTLRQGVEATLNRVCDFTGWHLGHAYLPEVEDPSVLSPSGIWVVRGRDQEQFAPFMERTGQENLHAEEGLFGKILANGEPVVMADVSQCEGFSRRETAVACDLHGGFGLAIMAGDIVFGVLEFYSMHDGLPAEELQLNLADIGIQLGRVAERARMFSRLEGAAHEAQQANRAKSEFLAAMSHELRTPLNAVIGFSEIIRDEAFGPVGNSSYSDYGNDIHLSGQHLLGLINNILDLSKIESGNDVLIEDMLDIPETIDTAIMLTGRLAQQHDIKLEVDLAENLPALRADDRKVKQILVNLISNAVKFTPAGGKVTLKAWSRMESGYVLQVIDNGTGIAAKDVSKALKPFVQLDGGFDRKHEGTGLGLPLTKALVEQHGGSLDLQGEVDVGTTVTVRFPAQRIVDFPAEIQALAAVASGTD